jgi:hypothetical protein
MDGDVRDVCGIDHDTPKREKLKLKFVIVRGVLWDIKHCGDI